MLASLLLVVSFWVNPAMNTARSGADFVHYIEELSDPNRELGFVAFKEQYLLNAKRTIVHFGHARWREAEQEAFDAAHWLHRDQRRQLVVTDFARDLCFSQAQARPLGTANRIDWFLVEGSADVACVERGRSSSAQTYLAPGSPECIGCSGRRLAPRPEH